MAAPHLVAAKPLELPSPSNVPFVGRETEREVLTKVLADVRKTGGQTWLVEGPAGMGKTRLVRWLEGEARRGGFQVHWGYCLKESNMPFFPFMQIFRRSGQGSGPQNGSSRSSEVTDLPALTIFEDERPTRLLERTAGLSRSHKVLVVSRDKPTTLRKLHPTLDASATVLQLSKSGEGTDNISPAQVDAMGERLAQHLGSSKGAVVSLTGLDYLVSQNGFHPILKLVQFLREEAEIADSHVLLTVNPATLETREMALLEGEGEIVRERAPELPAAPSAPEQPAMTMLRFLETMEREAPQQPSMLVIDDVQWADPDSLRTMQFLARNLRTLPVLMIGTVRSEEWRTPEEKTESILDDIVGKIDEEGTLNRLRLQGLGEAESQDLARSIVGMPLGSDDGTKENALLDIFRRAEGNPYFVLETMRQLAQEGLLRREGDHIVLARSSTDDGAARGEALPIPATLRRLVARRLSMLTAEEMELLRSAAVAGSEFDILPLSEMLHRPVAEVASIVRRLEKSLHILDASSEGDRWSFAHPLVWEVTLSETSPEERREKSLKLADWWAANRKDDIETVARLYHDATETKRGIPWVRKAIDQAISVHATEIVERFHRWLQDLFEAEGLDATSRVREGIELVERTLVAHGGSPASNHMLEYLAALPAPPAERIPARLLLIYSLTGMDAGRARIQLETLTNEIEHEHIELSLKWRGLLGLNTALIIGRQARYADALVVLRKLSDELKDFPEPWLVGHVACLRVFCAAATGLADEAMSALSDLREIMQHSRLSLIERWVYGSQAVIADLEGNLRMMEEGESLSNAMSRSRGDPRATCSSFGNLVIVTAYIGEFEASRAHFQEGMKIGNQFGFKDLIRLLKLGEGIALWAERRWQEAIPKLTDIVANSAGDLASRTTLLSLLAECQFMTGDLVSARDSINKSGEKKDELGPAEFANMLRIRAEIEEKEGNEKKARETLEEALRVLEEHPNMYWGGWVNAAMAHWEARHGERAIASSFRSKAESLFDRSGVLPANKPAWLNEIPS